MREEGRSIDPLDETQGRFEPMHITVLGKAKPASTNTGHASLQNSSTLKAFYIYMQRPTQVLSTSQKHWMQ